MKIIALVSAVLIVIGCFLPWLQLGTLFANRGIDNADGAIMLVAGVIAGGLAFYNQSLDKPKNTWIYLVLGILGLITAYLDLNEVTARAEKAASGLGELNSIIGGDKNISIMNFMDQACTSLPQDQLGCYYVGLLFQTQMPNLPSQ